jgi:glutathione reductase (NADPH)
VNQLVEATEAIGVEVHLESPVEAIENSSKKFIAHTFRKSGKKSFQADLVVHGAGRVPEIDDLDLEKAGIATKRA